ncbi:alpha-ketoglutarate-dependent dioxygenase AlkB [Pelagibacterium halotolerans]|uniref:alpha-ketoglutarate-dependent dioxygenase AlkB n=1 Tax=Pelagibacterium halotolerans TaxID=531813 RepID=UPI000896FA12|nr:alpha-ketoglutarate-dependent dioxygenase AlkB [Pelagibacterium halotolerans]QJR17896.1 alpha-ketoglutarate-dependent dioxygenase AlkB [Pelagibacterium halotolerans]SEA34427.1 Alkylated DNA repair dioxygenase AlkB [Pelagibacterium halotolerans]
MLPPDARYMPDYVDETHEAMLLNTIDRSAWLGDLKRRVQHYGFRYDYKSRRVTRESSLGPLPDWLSILANRLRQDGVFQTQPDQVIINEYLPGQGIAAHVDCEPCFGETVASLSLGSACAMEFAHVQSGRTAAHFLAPRSLLALSHQARFNWTHGIPARKSDIVDGSKIARGRRVSLTFRTVIIK